MSNVTIADIVNRYINDPATPPPEALVEALVAREEAIVGLLHLAAMQFGMYPQIVAKVILDVGLGAPKSEPEKQMIEGAFVHLMQQIEAAHRGDGPMPTP